MAFAPTHSVPATGLSFWHHPDPNRPADGTVEGGLPVEVVTAEASGWAQVRFSNGWETWIDGRTLVAAQATAAASGGFAPRYQIPTSGLEARDKPDVNSPPVARADPGLPVEVIGDANGWTQVRFSNGWETWIDGRSLVALGAGGSSAGASGVADPLALWLPVGGAAAVILGSLLAWYSVAGVSISAWDLPLAGLFDETSTSTSPKTGPVLLVVGLAAIPLLSKRPLPKVMGIVLGAVALFIVLLAFRLYTSFEDSEFGLAPDLGVGLILSLIGAGVMIVGALRSPN